jgi:arylformamidase
VVPADSQPGVLPSETAADTTADALAATPAVVPEPRPASVPAALPERGFGTDRAAWDATYLPGLTIPTDPYLRTYAERSARARESLSWREVRYGPGEAERLHLFPGPREDSPLLVFVHGGYWQQLTEVESSFAAPDALAAGCGFAALGYGLAPAHRLAEIAAMAVRGLTWLRNAVPGRVVLAGHSAGAHLVAHALVADQSLADAAVLLSGLYELAPLRHTTVGANTRMSEHEVATLSPVRGLHAGLPPLLVARGDAEPVGFTDQQDALVAAARRSGVPVSGLVVPGRNHFDLPLGLADSADPLGAAVLPLLAAGTARS